MLLSVCCFKGDACIVFTPCFSCHIADLVKPLGMLMPSDQLRRKGWKGVRKEGCKGAMEERKERN